MKTEKSIVACTYADTTGAPVLFGRKYFEHLKKLEGNEGAKGIIRKFEKDVATIAFPQGSIDIDTKEDYQKLLSEQE